MADGDDILEEGDCLLKCLFLFVTIKGAGDRQNGFEAFCFVEPENAERRRKIDATP